MAFSCIHCKSEIDPAFKACPFCGEAVTDFLRRYSDTPIDGKYQILSRLGVGGMGEVYKVLHVHLNAIRVIKLMRSNIASDPAAHERFLREARLATKINHPNVATLFDFSMLDDGSHYMVWEYIEGTNLHELIGQRGPLSPRYAAKLAVQALMGLDAIHRAGIVHRDVSPENLMIMRDVADYGAAGGAGEERVKIIDLGIAKSSAADDHSTKTGMFVGKWKYCSPEHLGMLASGERIDGRADLYSFGIVLYEMLSGVPPFQADTPHAFLMMHASERPKALRDVNPGVTAPPELEALIFQALEKDRANRYATARQFAQAIERITPLLPDAPGAPPPSPAFAEVTDEATRVARVSSEAETVMSVAHDAPTPPGQKTLNRVTQSGAAGFSPPVRQAKRPIGLATAAVVAILIAAGAWFMLREKPEPVAPVPAPLQASVLVPASPGRLGINAFPWANVTSIRNLENGEDVDLGAALVTPAPVDLAPGRYEVTLANPNFAAPITRTVSIAAGGEATLNVHFADPASAKLPDFGSAP